MNTVAWNTHSAGHELLHLLGAGHKWLSHAKRLDLADCEDNIPSTQCTDPTDIHDIMGPSVTVLPDRRIESAWQVDVGFNTYNDPAELSALFFIDPEPSGDRTNIATHPAVSCNTSACPDGDGYNNALTAQHTTAEQGTLSFSGLSAQLKVATSAYFDGRQSIRVETAGASPNEGLKLSGVTYTVTPGREYKLRAALRLSRFIQRSRWAELVVRWLDGSGGLVKTSRSARIDLKAGNPEWDGWALRSFSPVAPSGASQADIRIQTSTRQGRFAYFVDALQWEDKTITGS